jgi:rfaE bifunctional protein kinase chain/domain
MTKVKNKSNQYGKTSLVVGNFDVLHPGHIRLLSFAKEVSGYLIVAVNSDLLLAGTNRVNQASRLEMVASLECVDESIITNESVAELVTRIRPDYIVKGKEFESQHNPEQAIIEAWGGRLIFGSGEFELSSERLKRADKEGEWDFHCTDLALYAQRHHIELEPLLRHLEKIKTLKVGVIGEVIVDEYVHGAAVGLSQEDPTIVMTPSKTERFLGGAAITAGHIRALGAEQVHFVSVLGEDQGRHFAEQTIQDYQLKPSLLIDESRPTNLKTRYRADKKTLLRVNQVRQHKIDVKIQQQIIKHLHTIVPQIDLLVFSDFNYGVLPQALVKKIVSLCEKQGVAMVADSQTSSQVGDISRYHNMQLITPTEKEVRVALNNPDDGLVILADKLCKKASPKYLAITLGSEGIFIHIPDGKGGWENDLLPALNNNAADPAGAGDCFLASSSLMLAVGASCWEAFYVGSLASALQVSVVGNRPLAHKKLEQALVNSFRKHAD